MYKTKLSHLLFIVLIFSACDKKVPPAEYAGSHTCYECHQDETHLWRNSHHDLAMATVSDSTVLGDFNDVEHIYFDDTSHFFMEDGKYMVKTRGPEGEMETYEIEYTFGWTPLQQYLIEFPKGRYQMLPLCWDTRPAEEGGQRWFHLYPNEYIAHDDILHWTGHMQNWNYMCAECHSTNLKRNYDLVSNTYNTTWDEIDVSCESCHGPGSLHNHWAIERDKGKDVDHIPNKGVVFSGVEEDVEWVFDPDKGTAYRSEPRTDHSQIDMCARCHSRRFAIWDDYDHHAEFMQQYRPDILHENLYYNDGQIKEEVYVYGSFLQSKMYMNDVTCSDCHDMHSMQIKMPDKALCAQCHMPEKYDSYSHHFHKADSTGGSCIDCHMPETTYMVVDPRRDHSIRIPRPDLSLKIGSPNACNKCHDDKSTQWAANAFEEWYGNKFDTIEHFGEVFFAATKHDKEAQQKLVEIINSSEHPDIVRATAVSYLVNYYNLQNILPILLNTLKDKDELVLVTALQALANYPPQQIAPQVEPLLQHPIRAVRVEASRVLGSLLNQPVANVNKEKLKTAVNEYIQSVLVNAEQPGANVNLGVMYTNIGQLNDAEKYYRNALRLDSQSVAAWVNLADLARMQGQDAQSQQVLEKGLKKNPKAAELHYSMGLLKVRQKNNKEALQYLQKANELQPNDATYGYVYGIALNTTGYTKRALEVLEDVHSEFPNNQEVLIALITINRDAGNRKQALGYAEKMQAITPDNPSLNQLLRELKE